MYITQRQQWEQAKLTCAYRGDTLEYEGFIHCFTPLQLIQVTNRFFPNQTGLVLLCIDSDRVKAEIKYEGLETQELFPHIYGQLNFDAVLAESGGVFTDGVSPSDRHAGFYNGGNPRNEPAQLFKTKVLDFEPNANGKFDLQKQADDI